MKTHKKIVVIGGGTGSFVVLSGLKKYTADLTAVVTMMDSGGSTGRLRDQYGVLPPGDVRQALVAMSKSPQIWRELFLYRFYNGDFNGHNFGNIFLTVLEKITGDFEKGIELAEYILQTKGTVIPVTLEKTDIVAKLKNGRLIKTEALIDRKEKRSAIEQLFLDKQVPVNKKAVNSISEADFIIIGPGDLYTSIIPNFVFSDIVNAYKNSKAVKIFVLNLMNKMGQTDNFTATDFINTYSKILGRSAFDHILVNNSKIDQSIEERYESKGEIKIIDDLKHNAKYKIHRADFISNVVNKQAAGDKLSRSLLRHDSQKLANYIWNNIVSNEISK
jgi:uncharacterized cofD-like protein